MPKRWFSIRYCPTESLNWPRCPARLVAGVLLCGCMHYARREVRMRLVWEWLSRKKMTVTDTTVFFFWFWFQILLLYGGYPQRSAVWILQEGETPVPGRSCTGTTSAGDHHTRLRHFLGGIAHHRSKKKKNAKKAKNSYGLHLSYLYIEHKAVEHKNNEVLRDRSLFTKIPDTKLH